MREIEQEVYSEPEAAQKKDAKKTAAVDLSKRLKDLRSLNDAAGVKGVSRFPLQTFLNHNSLVATLFSEKYCLIIFPIPAYLDYH